MRSVSRHRLGLLFAAVAVLAAACGSTETSGPSAGASSSSEARDGLIVTAPLRPELAAGMREPETFPSRDLIGLTLPELRQRMGRGLLTGEISPMLVIAQDGGPAMSFLTLEDALADAWAAAYARGGVSVPAETTSCSGVFGPTFNPQAASASRALLVFRGELLTEIRHPQNIRRAPEERSRGDARKQPVDHVFLTEPGQLPLADGASFLRRWHSPSVGPSEQITVRCELRRSAAVNPGVRLEAIRSGLSADDIQEIALAPLAVFQPGGAERPWLSEGPATAALLQLGRNVPGGAAAFDSQHKRAWYYPGLAGYGVIAVDASLSKTRDFILYAGVRNERVEWIAQPGGGIGFPSAMMCLDAEFVPGKARKGCSDGGEFNPAR